MSSTCGLKGPLLVPLLLSHLVPLQFYACLAYGRRSGRPTLLVHYSAARTPARTPTPSGQASTPTPTESMSDMPGVGLPVATCCATCCATCGLLLPGVHDTEGEVPACSSRSWAIGTCQEEAVVPPTALFTVVAGPLHGQARARLQSNPNVPLWAVL